ncbi:junctional adhesion molecule B-like [Pelodiscus sinensis]|uniref:junctional adhesion molecule B-like n=1 Tax=Pelodiscus sinensis TaxID=13735 RepID=UPI003F6BD6E1
MVLSSNVRARLEVTAEKRSAGTYTCAYWRQGSNGEVSENSSSVSITVTDTPVPTLSLSPSNQLYLSGESVQLTCSAPSDNGAVTSFQFYKDRESIFLPSSSYSNVKNLELRPGHSGSYTCQYWTDVSGRKIQTEESPSVPITVTDHQSAPKLTLSPQHRILLRGESVTLMCSAPRNATVSGIRFFRDGQGISSGELQRAQNSVNASIQLSSVSESHAGEYRCDYWEMELEREIPSERSKNITIKVIDPPPQPVLSVDPPSGVLSERLPLLFTCTVPGSARDWRFHFYKNGDKFDPGDMGSERSTSEPTNSFRNISVLSITRAGPNNTGEFTCGYEQKVGKRWILSLRSQAVTVTLSASPSVRDILLGTGGVLLLIAALAALLCYCHRKKRVPKTPKSTAGSALGERTRNLDPGHDSKGSKAMGAGAEQMEQGSDVTYALLVLPTSQAHKTLSKNKAKPAEDEHVVYSKVVTTRTQKVAK